MVSTRVARVFTAVAPLAVVAPGGGVLPGQRAQLLVQSGLVGLDDQQVVGLLVLDEEPRVVTLGVQGVGGRRDTGQIERRQQRGEAGDLVSPARHPQLGDGLPVAGHRGQQMSCGNVSPA